MKIEKLDYSDYQGYKINVDYITRAYQDIQIKKHRKAISMSMKRKRMKKTTKSYDISLFADYINQPVVFGMFERKTLVAVIEGEYIEWNKTFRIWEIYIHPKYRRKGLGSQLFKHIERHAMDIKARAITLEVQSCNDPAISFYESMGMHFIGLNTLAYTNYDVQNKEVLLEYGKRLG